MTDGPVPIETLDLLLLGFFAVVSLFLLVAIHYMPSAELDRLERDDGLDRWSVWILCVVSLFVLFVLVARIVPTDHSSLQYIRARYFGYVGVGMFVTGVFTLGRAIVMIGPARQVSELERMPIGELTDGGETGGTDPENDHPMREDCDHLVALSGEAVATDGTVEAPFTGTEAVVYESTVFEPSDDYGESNADPLDEYDWRAANLFSDRVPFAIDDGTGRVRVEPTGATLELDQLDVFEVAGDEQAPERIEAMFLATQALNGTTRHRRYEEAALAPGDRVLIVGRLEDGTVSGGSDETWTVSRSPPFVITSKSLPRLQDEYRFRLVRGALGLFLSATGLFVYLRASGAV
ncbi:GIDE domain-containing protein [Haloarchaeobius amylolyticus]|uniref:RING-type E3 ubiquitin transferase n=1 Tax=Haloarchaeobius amylolyticus TaxID=1198296 RepID=A0ABD6BL74_9EURY